MSRTLSLILAGTTAVAMSAGSFTGAQAAPMPALSSAQVAGSNGTVEDVRYRGGRGYYGGGYGRGYYGGGYGRGYGYRRGGAGGALAAGAALGIIGGAIAASQAPRYGYYGGGYGYPAYGYGAPAYGYYDYGY